MNTEKFRQAIVTKVYQLGPDRKVPLHQHPKHDEIFYCIKGAGFGVLQNSEVELTSGKAFIVPAGTMHSLRTDSQLCVTSSLIPQADDPEFADPPAAP